MSTTFSVTRDQIINSALRLQGWLDFTATADATKVTQMAEALNIMIKAWSAKELKLWCVEELTLPLVAGQRSYTIAPVGANLTANRPLRIVEAFLRYTASTPDNDVPLQALSRQEYQMLGVKASPGVVNSYFYDAQIPAGVLYLYLQPNAFGAANTEVHLFSHRLVQDISSGSATFDFPSEWFQALRWGLAAETAEENQIPDAKIERIEAKAQMYLKQIEDWDVEPTSLFFQPDTQRMGERGC